MSSQIHTRFAAIEAGSNALRLVIVERAGADTPVALCYLREPVRLGSEAFRDHRFSPTMIQRAVQVFQRFADLMSSHDVKSYRAVATSAALDSTNGPALIEGIHKSSGIALEIIDEQEEARLVLDGIAGSRSIADCDVVLVDMGGGSVEVTVARDTQITAAHSFPLGPVRLLEQLRRDMRSESDVADIIAPWREEIRSFVRSHIATDSNRIGGRRLCLGAGGNLESLGKLRPHLFGDSNIERLSRSECAAMVDQLLGLDIRQRMERFELRPDRADIIAIAAQVGHMTLDAIDIELIEIPGVGLKEGLIQDWMH